MKVEAVYYTRNHKERYTANDYSYLQTTRKCCCFLFCFIKKQKMGEVYSVYTATINKLLDFQAITITMNFQAIKGRSKKKTDERKKKHRRAV